MNYITVAHNKCNENGLCSGNKFTFLDQAVMYAVMKLLVKAMSIRHGGKGALSISGQRNKRHYR